MVLELQRLAKRFQEAGLVTEANVLAAQADIFRAAGTPEELPDGAATENVIFPYKYDRKDSVELNGTIIYTLRSLDLGLTQQELAERTRIGNRKPMSHSTISQIEQGKITQITRFNAARIAHGLGVGLEEILAKVDHHEGQ